MFNCTTAPGSSNSFLATWMNFCQSSPCISHDNHFPLTTDLHLSQIQSISYSHMTCRGYMIFKHTNWHHVGPHLPGTAPVGSASILPPQRPTTEDVPPQTMIESPKVLATTRHALQCLPWRQEEFSEAFKTFGDKLGSTWPAICEGSTLRLLNSIQT